jgi:hypothetical protein
LNWHLLNIIIFITYSVSLCCTCWLRRLLKYISCHLLIDSSKTLFKYYISNIIDILSISGSIWYAVVELYSYTSSLSLVILAVLCKYIKFVVGIVIRYSNNGSNPIQSMLTHRSQKRAWWWLNLPYQKDMQRSP